MKPEIKERIEQIKQGEVPEGYKKTKVGVIPDNWAYDFLERLSINGISNGIFNDPSKVGKGTKLINVVHLYEEPVIKTDKLALLQVTTKEFEKYKVIKGDVFFTRSSLKLEGIAKANINISNDKLIYDCHIMRVRPNQEIIDPMYLKEYCLCNKARKFFMINAKQTTMTTIGQNDIAKLPVIFPSLNQQKYIVSILSTWDRAIELKEQLIEEKKKLKKGLMQNLLTGKVRLPGFDGEWEEFLLGDVAEMSSGGTPKTTSKNYYEGGDIPWVSITDMTNKGKYIDSTEKKINTLGLKNSSAKIYPLGTVLFAMYASIGECSISKVELTSSQAILGIRPSQRLNNEYLYYLLSSAKNSLKLQGQQGTQNNFNAGMVKSLKFPLPHMDEQKEIVKILLFIEQELDLLHQELTLLKQQKKSLMQLLLTGIVRVPEAHVETEEMKAGVSNG